MSLLYTFYNNCFLAETTFGYVLHDEDEAPCVKDYHLAEVRVYLQEDGSFYVTGERRKFQFFNGSGRLENAEMYIDSEYMHSDKGEVFVTTTCWLELKDRAPFCLKTKNLSFIGESFLNEI